MQMAAPKFAEARLDGLLHSRTRSEWPLHPFRNGFTNGWACAVPAAFRAALDIRQTAKKTRWTQGTNFSFNVGDTFYDAPEAYELPWAEAVKLIGYGIQVKDVQASEVGEVGFDILTPNEARTALSFRQMARATQAEFVRLLITGSCSGLSRE
jgi:hypothetical protein